MTPSRTFPSRDIFRARLILLLADGLPYRSIEERLDTTAPTIARWKKHFLEDRVAGQLESRHPGQKPLRVHARTASQGTERDATHWSCRKLAQHLGITKDAVQHGAGLKPHGLES
jgi:hypothetical protein